MCGIVAYLGKRDAVSVVVSGLEKLEYRGYDSAGVSVIENQSFETVRARGKLKNLKNLLSESGKAVGSTEVEPDRTENNIGIGHTRWATHGRPSENNAHPHVAGQVCVVHNGIIENYRILRTRLEEEGCSFSSETDSEIVAHLINFYLESSDSLLDAVRTAISELEGSYALVVLSLTEPDTLVVAKNSTPVVVGLSKDEVFVASDIPAILEYTRDVLILEDGDLAEIKIDSLYLESNGAEIKRKPMKVTWDPITAEKGGYRHFMLKEINEQPLVVSETFRSRVKQEQNAIFLDDVNLGDKEFQAFKRICIVACGTAMHAGLVTKYYIEHIANIPVEVDYASEFRYRKNPLDTDTLFVVISQSGETIDTLGALKRAKDAGLDTLAICNVVGSSIARMSDNVIYTHAGPEISVASTKAFVTQLTAGLLLALRLGIARACLSQEEAKEHIDQLMKIPSRILEALKCEEQIEKLAKSYGASDHFLYLGRGLLYPIALEGALKLKEISYVHAEGYPAGEMKHGPIALINEDLPVVVVLGKDGVNYEKTMSNLIEVNARGGRIIAITDVENPQLDEVCESVICLGEMSPLAMPIVFTIPLQLLAYHVALHRGTDVDQPRNLAKSVTVE